MPTENVTPISLSCPTCGKEMKLTGHAPTCESMIYDFLCSDDGDRLSWLHRNGDRAMSASDQQQPSANC